MNYIRVEFEQGKELILFENVDNLTYEIFLQKGNQTFKRKTTKGIARIILYISCSSSVESVSSSIRRWTRRIENLRPTRFPNKRFKCIEICN